MKLSEYDDESLLEEVKHRGFKIEIVPKNWWSMTSIIKIGGVEFELRT